MQGPQSETSSDAGQEQAQYRYIQTARKRESALSACPRHCKSFSYPFRHRLEFLR